MNWSPLHNFTHYSTGLALSKPEDLIKKCVEYDYKSCAITDDCSLSGAISFHSYAKKAGIKPIIGTKMGDVILLAKNKNGWKNLIKITSTKNLFNYNEDDSIIAIAKRSDYESEFNLKLKYKDFYYMDEVLVQENPSMYTSKEHKELYSILLSSNCKKPLTQISKWANEYKLLNDGTRFLPTPDMYNNCTNQEIVDKCENYDIIDGLNLPIFPFPSEYNSEYEYLVQLCRDGWRKKISGKVNNEQVYLDRVKKELSVVESAGLQGYFLIVQDYINWAKNQGWLVGKSRGSSGGSLICYLLNITEIDPIKYGLIFERFYNEGRNTKDNKELPDIDTDFPKFKRDEVLNI